LLISIALRSLDVDAALKDGLGRTFSFDMAFVDAMLEERAATDFLALRREDGVGASLLERGVWETCKEKLKHLFTGRHLIREWKLVAYRLAKGNGG
jgi:hypothetical protein